MGREKTCLTDRQKCNQISEDEQDWPNVATLNNMSLHGTLPELTGKDWSSYQVRLGFYFEANDIGNDAANKRRAILLSVVETET